MSGGLLDATLANWASYYANHATARTVVAFAHVGALIAGAGAAVTADRTVLAVADPRDRRPQAERVQTTHRIVLIGLALVTVSGVLLFAADVATFLYSRMFWIKMALVVLLIANGVFVLRAERQVLDQPDDIRWRRLRLAAAFSLALWFLTTLAGVALPNIG
jgi:uncharacterized membrane protein